MDMAVLALEEKQRGSVATTGREPVPQILIPHDAQMAVKHGLVREKVAENAPILTLIRAHEVVVQAVATPARRLNLPLHPGRERGVPPTEVERLPQQIRAREQNDHCSRDAASEAEERRSPGATANPHHSCQEARARRTTPRFPSSAVAIQHGRSLHGTDGPE